ncbi:hypothetical protein AAG906_039731 [Vitis piasezkii]
MFLTTIGHRLSNMMIQERFQHSGECLLEALRRLELGFPHPPRGKYYLLMLIILK